MSTDTFASNEALGFDPDALREKYQRERDKRLRADGNDQYREVQGDLRAFVDDPYVEPGFVRDPVREELEIVIIGGGFGGLVAGARLHAAGFTDVRIVKHNLPTQLDEAAEAQLTTSKNLRYAAWNLVLVIIFLSFAFGVRVVLS